LWLERRKGISVTKEKYAKKHGIDKANELSRKKACIGKHIMINKYGIEEGTDKWNSYLKKWKHSYKENKQYHKPSNTKSLNFWVNRLGKEEGTKKYNFIIGKQKYRFSKQYYIDTYGKEQGEIEWQNYIASMNKTSLTSFISRYGDKKGNKKFKKYLEKLKRSHRSTYYSKVSQELFWSIYNLLPQITQQYCRFAEFGGEEKIYYINDYDIFYPDFKLCNVVIEFDGDYWHSRETTIIADKLREEKLISKGYEVLRIKEKDYSLNEELILDNCIEFIKENINET